MKKILATALLLGAGLCAAPQAHAQFNLKRAASAVAKGVEAATISDAQMAAYARESVDWMDTHNRVSTPGSDYAERLARLTAGLTDADGIPLNFKVYEVIDVNAFACPDGSVRVFSSLMDIMTDDELLGVIGHEIGHVAKRHSKNAFKTSLMTDALKDAAASTSKTAAKLTDSDLGKLSSALMNAKYSQKQEKEADDFGYEFLKKHGKNPWGMVMAFEKLDSMSEGAGKASYLQRMFSSHPETKERIKRMEQRCGRDGIARPASN